jgi:hypothetical protein
MLGSTINPTNNDPAKKLTSRAVTVSTQVIAGDTTREREATSASMPRPVIHPKMSPTNGQLIARQKSGSIPLGTEARCASPTNRWACSATRVPSGLGRLSSGTPIPRRRWHNWSGNPERWRFHCCWPTSVRCGAQLQQERADPRPQRHPAEHQLCDGSTHRNGKCAVHLMEIAEILSRSQRIGN